MKTIYFFPLVFLASAALGWFAADVTRRVASAIPTVSPITLAIVLAGTGVFLLGLARLIQAFRR